MNGKLLPVIPRFEDGEDKTGNPPHPSKVDYLLKKYGHLLADTVICFEEEPSMVELILDYGKKVVPIILGDRENVIFDWEERGYKLNWIRWVLDNADRFEGVTLGNLCLEVTNHFDKDTPTEKIIDRLLAKFPSLVGKLVLAPFHYDVADDVDVLGYPLREAMLRAGPWHTIYWGYWFLDQKVPEMKEWLKPIKVYSGINYSSGADAHNLPKSLDLGYVGCLFFLPVHSTHSRADELMNLYLTDVRR